MLYTSFFDVDHEGLQYYGYNHYTVTQDRTGYAVHVKTLDEEGNATPGETYAASSLSTAIQTIENLEASA